MAKHHDDTGSVHPIESFVHATSRALTALSEQPLWTLDPGRTRTLVHDLAALAAQVAELEARALAHARDAGLMDQDGASSLGTWLAHSTRLTRGEAARKVRLAGLGEQTRCAMARGEVHAEQALVIAQAVAELPEERERAEKHLLGEAVHHDAHDLRRLGQRILEHLDPDRADAHEARLLEQQEARAAKATRLSMSDDGDGVTRGTFTIPTAVGAMLRKALQAHAAPKHVRAVDGPGSYDHAKPTPAKLGEAFVDYVERYPADRLPTLGGVNATVVVTVDVGVLDGAHRAARLDTGDSISPGQLRRWACSAGILPAVMDGAGRVLDLGRTRRFHTSAQRIAVGLEQRRCQHPTCSVPASLCHLHHRIAWSKGGGTSVDDAVLLCPFHHHRAHAHGVDYPLRT